MLLLGGEGGQSLSRTHEASGERIAPLGRTKPALGSKATPVPSRLAHRRTCMLISELRQLVTPPVGTITSRCACALRSMRHSQFS